MSASLASCLASLPEAQRLTILAELSDDDLAELEYDWRFWARPEQIAPEGDWSTWLALAGRGWGKALPLVTPVPTPSGWSTMGELSVGDFVIGSDGVPTRVTFATDVQFDRNCYLIKFSDGAEIIADEDHQWAARSRADRRAGREYRSVTTGDMRRKLTVANERNWQMPAASALSLPKANLPIDPWVFGFWLGDGGSKIASVTIGDEDAAEIIGILKERGEPVTGGEWRKPGSKCATYPIGGKPYVRDAPGRMAANGSLHSRLRELAVLGNKRIPICYLRASEDQRTDILAGLIDSDGYVEHETGRIEITSCSKELADDICELAKTLGHRARIYEGNAKIGDRVVGIKRRVVFVARSGGGLLQRKRLKDRSHLGQPDRLTTRYVDSIEPVESVPVRCISVDADDRLYLAGRDFLVTHNTEAGAQWIRERVDSGARSIALVAETQKDLEEVMVARLVSIYPPEQAPSVRFKPVRVTWQNGATALGYNGTEPNQLRGPEFDTAWVDELAKYRYAREAWDMLQFTMRAGTDPRIFVTTTPRPIPIIRELIADRRALPSSATLVRKQ